MKFLREDPACFRKKHLIATHASRAIALPQQEQLANTPVWVVGSPLRWFVTFHVICFAWVFFRAESFSNALDVLTAVVAFSGDDQVSSLPVLLLILVAVGTQFISKARTEQFSRWRDQHSALAQGVMFGIGLVLIDLFGPEGVAPFIYFQF